VKSAEPHVATIEEPTANGASAKPAQPASPRHDSMEGDAVIERELAENGESIPPSPRLYPFPPLFDSYWHTRRHSASMHGCSCVSIGHTWTGLQP